MKNRKNLDLLTEVNLMRNMMGLNPKSLLNESIIPVSLLISFAKTATRYAGKTVVEIATELGAAAKSTKKMFDDLDIAIKAGDSTKAKTMVINIMSSLDNNGLKVIANDLLSDDNFLKPFITKRAKTLKGGGMSDDLVKNQIKNDIDTILEDIPEGLKKVVKDQADDIVDTTLRGVKSVEDNAELIAKAMREELQLQKTIADQFNTISLKIEGLPSFNTLSSTEKSTVRKLLKDTVNKTPNQLFAETDMYIIKILSDPAKVKDRKWLTSLGQTLRDPKGILLTIGGGAILVITLLLLSGNIGAAKYIYEKNKKDWDEAGEEDSETLTGDCPGKSQFVDEVKAAYDDEYDSSKIGDFDNETCTGTYDGTSYSWNGASFD